MRIFISYSSRHRDVCERLQLALEADGRHEVFVDRSELAPGQPFDASLREGLANCDLLLFLISPESVAAGSYAMAELSLAKARWRTPGGHVLPVKVAPTPLDSIPAYLRAVTILEPQGDVVAETVAAVEAYRGVPRFGPHWGRAAALGLAALVLLGALGEVGYQHWQQGRQDAADVAMLGSTSQQLCDSGDTALGWQRYADAITRHPNAPVLRRGREDCGMLWLRYIHVKDHEETFTQIVERVLPVLVEGAASATGQRAADLLAHMGWADFLRVRDGASRLDPSTHYAQAMAAEPSNVFAQAMWGHWVMVGNGPIADARQHFTAALASGRERAFVRRWQLSAMLYHHDADGEIEAARVLDDMRKHSDAADTETRERVWTYVYTDAITSTDRRDAFLAAMSDANHAETFAWLFPEDQVQADRLATWRYCMASLEEAGGAKAAARAHYEALRDQLTKDRAQGRMLDGTLAAIKRLQGS